MVKGELSESSIPS